jgi:hypothetical protein
MARILANISISPFNKTTDHPTLATAVPPNARLEKREKARGARLCPRRRGRHILSTAGLLLRREI